jgi:radical SAM protein with 4Fe4S-binding SPASM domain
MSDDLLSPGETREFFAVMAAAATESAATFGATDIYMGRSLQFLVGGGMPYRCSAGETLLTVMPNGDLHPCRRLPIPIGNVLEARLENLYFDSPWLTSLRAHRVGAGCESCRFAEKCRGGLRCLAYATNGDPFRADPGCWRAVRSQPLPASPAARP